MLFYQCRPKTTCSSQLGNFHIKIHPYTKKEAISRSNIINFQSSLINSRPNIFQSIGNCKSKFQCQIRSGFLHVISTNTDCIKFGHMYRSISYNVSHYSIHRWLWRINVCITNHEFLQNIILNCSSK